MNIFKNIILLSCILGLLASPFALQSFAADPEPEKIQKYPSEELEKNLKKIMDAINGKKFKTARRDIDRLLRSDKIDPISYDTALLSNLKAHSYLQESKYKEALPNLEKAYEMGVKYALWDRAELQRMLFVLAQVNYLYASEIKNTAEKKRFYEKSIELGKLWISKEPKPNATMLIFISNAYFQLGTIEKTPNREFLKQAIDYAWKNLTLQLKVDEKTYQLIVAALYQMEDVEKTTEILELQVKENPTKKETWQQLLALYNAIAQKALENKDPVAARENQLRMVVTMERAQKHNILNTPKDNMTLVAIYFQLEEFDQAALLLEQFIKENKLEDNKVGYDLLSSAYFRLNEPEKAIDALKRSAEAFPDKGDIEVTIAQFYLTLEDQKNANLHLTKAIEKGNLEKQGTVYLMLSFTAYELGEYDNALKWAQKSLEYPDVEKKNSQRMIRAAGDMIFNQALDLFDRESTMDPGPKPALKLAQTALELKRYDDAIRWAKDAGRRTSEEKEQKEIENLVQEMADTAYKAYPKMIENTSDREKTTLMFSMVRACITLKKFDEAEKWAEDTTPLIKHSSQEKSKNSLLRQFDIEKEQELINQEIARLRAQEKERVKATSKQ